jgi:hypothetical protein
MREKKRKYLPTKDLKKVMGKQKRIDKETGKENKIDKGIRK